MKKACFIFGVVLASWYGVTFVGMLFATLAGLMGVDQAGDVFALIISHSFIGALSMFIGAAIACAAKE